MVEYLSNSNKRRDFLRFEIEKYGKNIEVFIAVAFFTDSNLIKYLLKNGCTVYLIVRLGFPTNPLSLREVMNLQNVFVRYYTARQFHPKLYLLGEKAVIIGSSNLTDGGLIGNQELNVLIDPEDPSFDEIQSLFADYWEYALPLTKEKLSIYEDLVSSLQDANSKVNEKIEKRIGKVIYPNIGRDKIKRSKSVIFEERFLKKYQLFLGKFRILLDVYNELGKRKIPEKRLPLRIEIDQFLNWVRNERAYGDLYLKSPERMGKDLISFIEKTIDEFMQSDYSYIYKIADLKYPLIMKNFSTVESIESLADNELLETLLVVHAFGEHQKRSGSENADEFMQINDINKIKKTLKYLLFGKGDYASRIAKCIFDEEYALGHFGKSCIKETFGWINNQNIPICNERTLKSMQWLGFGSLG